MPEHYGTNKFGTSAYGKSEMMGKRAEMEGSTMIKSDMTAFVNLPQKSFMKEYPQAAYNNMVSLDDTLMGIDRQIKGDVGGTKKGKYPEKY